MKDAEASQVNRKMCKYRLALLEKQLQWKQPESARTGTLPELKQYCTA